MREKAATAAIKNSIEKSVQSSQIKSAFLLTKEASIVNMQKNFIISVIFSSILKKIPYTEPTSPLYYVSQYDSLGLSFKLKEVGH